LDYSSVAEPESHQLHAGTASTSCWNRINFMLEPHQLHAGTASTSCWNRINFMLKPQIHSWEIFEFYVI
jgi:hypothetical protein